ncbi:hypothetical protein [Lysobacter soyae]|uniref:Uncharacterized protein n=1 Tax=Lysobacter soyae TaxID=2764185 RepID=A0ABX8WRA5_9GAMM|nr:hypothetical protein [Lysobacter sp. CJ11]QYR53369.1 hypothetical protein H8L67_02335 [Lysobacter sp. CJ11]
MRKTFLSLAMSVMSLTAFNASAASQVAAPTKATSASKAAATRCRGDSGRFIKCAPNPVAAHTCRDAKGKFASCKA